MNLVSLKIGLAVALNFVVLPACFMQAWTPADRASIKPGHPPVDTWKWEWLRPWYDNTEDGVSGQQAIIWDASGHLVPYMPNSNPVWRAICWNARNNANNIKRPLRKDTWLVNSN